MQIILGRPKTPHLKTLKSVIARSAILRLDFSEEALEKYLSKFVVHLSQEDIRVLYFIVLGMESAHYRRQQKTTVTQYRTLRWQKKMNPKIMRSMERSPFSQMNQTKKCRRGKSVPPDVLFLRTLFAVEIYYIYHSIKYEAKSIQNVRGFYSTACEQMNLCFQEYSAYKIKLSVSDLYSCLQIVSESKTIDFRSVIANPIGSDELYRSIFNRYAFYKEKGPKSFIEKDFKWILHNPPR